ncbi:sodium:proton antiporter [Ornithinimicrobium tianjinense]|uniref:Sodium:proton antiporter n=1 Tax=Ornithinimicrobium tianjinense TaxID=1195761 RepID=A0A917BDM8_9MICO|nr:sodium:proton antiporter [Ornithinimicrobium tianjinense]GGF37232.1 sodium:proton antiporter [Ornithinimicrobium tianjinense]
MQVQWWGMIPFVLMLGTIAVAPLVPAVAHYWEQQRVQLLVALVLGLPVAIWFLAGGELTTVVHALVEYGQFIALLLALFVVSGGIYLAGDIRATPRVNTLFLAVGAVLASFIGTTGAAMLLIRPLLNTNAQRVHRVHTVVFTIFIVANTGGLLTPLGDPPLFLGMLRGVPFTWTFSLWPEWLFVNILLLVTYYGLDRRLYASEPPQARADDASEITPLRIKGGIHFIYLGLIVLAVAFAPSVDLHAIEEGHAHWWQWVPWREIVMISMALLSLRTGDRTARWVDNNFKWGPIQEVAALFIGIFLTMMPALRFLAQVAPDLPLNRVTFFLFTGGLSAVLDNAPTYVTFFEMARELGGDPAVAGVLETYLVSISLGAVFCGAITYIGNGPNFMTKAVADGHGVAMPSFGGYVVLAFRYLVPVLLAMMCIFLTGVLWAQVLGVVLAVALLARALRPLVMRKHALSPEH